MKIYTHETTELRRLAFIVAIIGLTRNEPYSQMHNELVIIPKKNFLEKVRELDHESAMEYNRAYEYLNNVYCQLSTEEYQAHCKRRKLEHPIIISAIYQLADVMDTDSDEFTRVIGNYETPVHLHLTHSLQNINPLNGNRYSGSEASLIQKLIVGYDWNEVLDKKQHSVFYSLWEDIVDACTSDDRIPHADLISLEDFPINGYPGKSQWPTNQTNRKIFEGLEEWIKERITHHSREF